MRRSMWIPAGVILVLMLIPWAVELHPNTIDLMQVLQPPSQDHLLGTDENGRDVLSRLLAGAQMTLGIGLASATLSVTIGSLLGVIAGSQGRLIDDLIMRATDLAMALPTLFVVLIFSSILSPGVIQLILLIGLTGWMSVARVVRGAARELTTREFVVAAHGYGAGRWQIAWCHILPNVRSVIVVAAILQLSRAILTEATISFLGVGIQPPDATWGSMLSSAQSYLLIAPWMAFAPGIALTGILLLVANINFATES